jgi:hypothetical protein
MCLGLTLDWLLQLLRAVCLSVDAEQKMLPQKEKHNRDTPRGCLSKSRPAQHCALLVAPVRLCPRGFRSLFERHYLSQVALAL